MMFQLANKGLLLEFYPAIANNKFRNKATWQLWVLKSWAKKARR